MDDNKSTRPDFSMMNTDELYNQIVVYLKTIDDREKMYAIALTVYDYAFHTRHKRQDEDQVKYDQALKKQTMKARLLRVVE
jgi:hypothetical protein